MADMTINASHGHDTHGHGDGHAHDQERIANQKLGMWLYLASEVVIFSMLIAGYVIFRVNQPESTRLVQETLGVTLVTINTFILLASSYLMVLGLREIEQGNVQKFMQWIGGTAVLGAVFLGGQFLEYSELQHLGITLRDNDFSITTPIFEETVEVETLEGGLYDVDFINLTAFEALELEGLMVGEGENAVDLASRFNESGNAELTQEEYDVFNAAFSAQIAEGTSNFGMRFYAPTAFHGAHVLVGVLWALLVLWRGYRGVYNEDQYGPLGVEIFGLYWHFVDVVWILLFTVIYLI